MEKSHFIRSLISVFEKGYTVDVTAADGNIAVIITDKEMDNPFRISSTIAEMTDDKIQEAIDELIEAVKHVRTNKAAWLEEAKRKIEEELRESAKASKSSKDKKEDKKDAGKKSMFDENVPAKSKVPDSVNETAREATNEEAQKIVDKTKNLIPKPEPIKEQKPKSSIPIVGASNAKQEPEEPEEPEIAKIPDGIDDDGDSPFIGGNKSDDNDSNQFTPNIPGDENVGDNNDGNDGDDTPADDNPFSVSSWV